MSEIDPAIPFWPRALAPQSIGSPSLVKPLIEGPHPISGTAQVAISDAGFWQFQLQDIPVYDATSGGIPVAAGNKLLLWRALYHGTLAMGRPVYMRLFDWSRSPRARAGLPLFGPVSSFSDGSILSDGTSFQQGAGDVVIAANAAYRASSIVVDVQSAAVPVAGDFFSAGDRLHVIHAAIPDDSIAGRWTWSIAPGLRYAVTVGDVVEVADPICKMVISPRDRSKVETMEYGRVGRPTLTFFEANWNA